MGAFSFKEGADGSGSSLSCSLKLGVGLYGVSGGLGLFVVTVLLLSEF